MTQRQNEPTCWAYFRAFRQRPTPIIRRRHGNRKHGRYSKSCIEGMRMLRLCDRILRGRLQHVPASFFDRPAPPGWSAYRAARDKARSQPSDRG